MTHIHTLLDASARGAHDRYDIELTTRCASAAGDTSTLALIARSHTGELTEHTWALLCDAATRDDGVRNAVLHRSDIGADRAHPLWAHIDRNTPFELELAAGYAAASCVHQLLDTELRGDRGELETTISRAYVTNRHVDGTRIAALLDEHQDPELVAIWAQKGSADPQRRAEVLAAVNDLHGTIDALRAHYPSETRTGSWCTPAVAEALCARVDVRDPDMWAPEHLEGTRHVATALLEAVSNGGGNRWDDTIPTLYAELADTLEALEAHSNAADNPGVFGLASTARAITGAWVVADRDQETFDDASHAADIATAGRDELQLLVRCLTNATIPGTDKKKSVTTAWRRRGDLDADTFAALSAVIVDADNLSIRQQLFAAERDVAGTVQLAHLVGTSRSANQGPSWEHSTADLGAVAAALAAQGGDDADVLLLDLCSGPSCTAAALAHCDVGVLHFGGVATLRSLSELLGEHPQHWTTFAGLAGDHDGTVGELAERCHLLEHVAA